MTQVILNRSTKNSTGRVIKPNEFMLYQFKIQQDVKIMTEDVKSGKSGNKPTRFKPTCNRIEIKRSFVCFDGRCRACKGLLLVFKIKSLCWDLVMDEERKRARVSAELGKTLKEIREFMFEFFLMFAFLEVE